LGSRKRPADQEQIWPFRPIFATDWNIGRPAHVFSSNPARNWRTTDDDE